jgi:nucleotide-binding universal stress UspA family protein
MRYDVFYEVLTREELERWTSEAETYLKNLQSEFREKGIATEIYVGHGHVVEEIIHAAEQQGAELIAMASHGRTGLGRVFYGSVAAGVLHRIDRPLLLIRAEQDD